MLRVLIVEDESPVLRKVADLVARMGMFEITDTVTDGSLAQASIRAAKPDILITDIQMPVIDGIELSGWVRGEGLDIEIIVISGYERFEYARKSLEYNVFAYILKPVDAGEFSDCLRKCAASILRRRQAEGCDFLANRLLSGGSAAFPGGSAACSLCLVCMGSLPLTVCDALSPECAGLNALDFDGLFREEGAPASAVWHARGMTAHERVLLLRGTPEEVARRAEIGYRRLCDGVFPVTIGVSAPLSREADIAPAHALVREAMMNRSRYGASSLLMPGEPDETRPTAANAEALAEGVRREGLEGFFRELQAQAETWRALGASPRNLYDNIFTAFDCLRGLAGAGSVALADNLHQRIARLLTETCDYGALMRAARGLVREAAPEAPARRDSIEQARQYICDHLCERISSKSVAIILGFSPAYFSHLFFERYGMSPTNYITLMRIRRAESLISGDANLSVGQVAAMVGFNDPFYFSRRFKGLTGLSPSEYRDKRGE